MLRATPRLLAIQPPNLRRAWAVLTALAILFLGSVHSRADEKVIRIGYQKYGTLVLLKGKGLLEQRLKPLGYRVTWAEFPSGPPLLEALNAGAVDLGSAGEAPPIFAQAANPDLLYVAHEPAAPKGEAILVAKDGPIRSVADLRGKRVALNKGSNVHYFLVKALEQAGVPYEAITPTFLGPADAAAAFAGGAVDAWAIWDPYLASGERSTGGRILVDGTDLVPNRQFYLSTKPYAAANGPALDATLAAIGEIDAWAKDNTDAVAAELAPSVGIPAPILTVALRRLTYGVTPLNAAVIADQQAVADSFHRLGMLPKPLDVASAVRKPGS
ncbi:aliphatic sulfonate ABC transporter substrate-binding protein [Methylobacterium sp. BTF04]|uniref:aliphatic sulfonate ABC transporter substrate-binding protein n=1 Tax=Methylobacterium sp. BTF04 TaxID=2708300 RepID=UPI0013CF5BF9|nr:aliphatic sulfonate ABC transporter substrate-binding protein [Methylobacterium sp. BTF04]NEU14354.1 aliphatic sulfonate ABC transporter substrate-binding protein [Methylobacterium sp. BTF04]